MTSLLFVQTVVIFGVCIDKGHMYIPLSDFMYLGLFTHRDGQGVIKAGWKKWNEKHKMKLHLRVLRCDTDHSVYLSTHAFTCECKYRCLYSVTRCKGMKICVGLDNRNCKWLSSLHWTAVLLTLRILPASWWKCPVLLHDSFDSGLWSSGSWIVHTNSWAVMPCYKLYVHVSLLVVLYCIYCTWYLITCTYNCLYMHCFNLLL